MKIINKVYDTKRIRKSRLILGNNNKNDLFYQRYAIHLGFCATSKTDEDVKLSSWKGTNF